ncbi:MAG: hypothetical protein MSS85_08330 [Pyramidobacter sp.]|nr:hypothetical protein [Pyramidobacter sp.]
MTSSNMRRARRAVSLFRSFRSGTDVSADIQRDIIRVFTNISYPPCKDYSLYMSLSARSAPLRRGGVRQPADAAPAGCARREKRLESQIIFRTNLSKNIVENQKLHEKCRGSAQKKSLFSMPPGAEKGETDSFYSRCAGRSFAAGTRKRRQRSAPAAEGAATPSAIRRCAKRPSSTAKRTTTSKTDWTRKNAPWPAGMGTADKQARTASDEAVRACLFLFKRGVAQLFFSLR